MRRTARRGSVRVFLHTGLQVVGVQGAFVSGVFAGAGVDIAVVVMIFAGRLVIMALLIGALILQAAGMSVDRDDARATQKKNEKQFFHVDESWL